MNTKQSLQAAAMSVLAGGFVALLLGAGLAGCAGGGSTAVEQPQTYTQSDEPESRKRATNRLKLAVLYFQDAKFNFALDEIKQAIQTDSNWFEPYGMRGLIYLQTGDYALAEGSFQKALAINPQSADTMHNYGFLLCKMKRPAEAQKMFNAALAEPAYGQRAKTWSALANCQLGNGQQAEAEASFMRSYELDAANPATGYMLANLMFQRGDAVRAQFYARRVNNGERASAESLWLGVKIERSLGNREAQAQLEAQLRRRFGQSTQAMALERGEFNE
ncbi:MAG: type IV pilus biogenesis/stability protein PilW [Rhodoferax sp.]|nr:type IV pilus biogenesis/stability protein PilW [Rhodoferax sp.]